MMFNDFFYGLKEVALEEQRKFPKIWYTKRIYVKFGFFCFYKSWDFGAQMDRQD